MGTEVLAQLVLVAVFKTVGSYGNHVIGGFDSHALPPLLVTVVLSGKSPNSCRIQAIGSVRPNS